MWFATLPSGVTIWIKPGSSYTIGRKTNDLVLNLKSVSKLHATIRAPALTLNNYQQPEKRYAITIFDHGSKGGTYINGSTERIESNTDVDLTNRCTKSENPSTTKMKTIISGNDNECYIFLRFGKIKSSERYDEIQLTWIPIIMTYSSGGSFPVSSTDEKRHQYEWLSPYVKYVQPLGVKMIPEFLKNTAVYIKPNSVPDDNHRNSWNSNKLILALARNLPVVTPEFTETLYTLFTDSNSQIDKRFTIQFKSPFTGYPDDISALTFSASNFPTTACKITESAVVKTLFPDPTNFLPDNDEKLIPDSARQSLFRGLLFVIWGSKQYLNLEPIITTSGGKCIEFEDTTLEAENDMDKRESVVIQKLTSFLDLQANSLAHRGSVRIVPVQPEFPIKAVEKHKVQVMMRAARRQAIGTAPGPADLNTLRNQRPATRLASRTISKPGKEKVYKPVCLPEIALSIRNISINEMLQEIDTHDLAAIKAISDKTESEAQLQQNHKNFGNSNHAGNDPSIVEQKFIPTSSNTTDNILETSTNSFNERSLVSSNAPIKVEKDSQLHVEHSPDILSNNADGKNPRPKKSQVNTSTKTVAKRHNPFLSKNTLSNSSDVAIRDTTKFNASSTESLNPSLHKNSKFPTETSGLLGKSKNKTETKSRNLFDLWSAIPLKTEEPCDISTERATLQGISGSKRLIPEPISTSTPDKESIFDSDDLNVTHISGTDRSIETSDQSQNLSRVGLNHQELTTNILKGNETIDGKNIRHGTFLSSPVKPKIKRFNILGKQKNSHTDTTNQQPQGNKIISSQQEVENDSNLPPPTKKQKVTFAEALRSTKKSLSAGKVELRRGRIVTSTPLICAKPETDCEGELFPGEEENNVDNTNNEAISELGHTEVTQEMIGKVKSLVKIEKSFPVLNPENQLQKYHLNPLPKNISVFDNKNDERAYPSDQGAGFLPVICASNKQRNSELIVHRKPLNTVIISTKGNLKWVGRRNFKTFRKVLYDKNTKTRILVENGSIYGGGIYGKADTIYGKVAALVPNSITNNQKTLKDTNTKLDRVFDGDEFTTGHSGGGDFIVVNNAGEAISPVLYQRSVENNSNNTSIDNMLHTKEEVRDDDSLFVGGHSRYLENDEQDETINEEKDVKIIVHKEFDKENDFHEKNGLSLDSDEFDNVRIGQKPSFAGEDNETSRTVSNRWRIVSSGTRALSRHNNFSRAEPVTKSFISCLTDPSTANDRIEPDSELRALANTTISTKSNTTNPDAHGDSMGFTITKSFGSSPVRKNGTRLGASKRLGNRKKPTDEDEFDTNNIRVAKSTPITPLKVSGNNISLSQSVTVLRGSVPEMVTPSFIGRTDISVNEKTVVAADSQHLSNSRFRNPTEKENFRNEQKSYQFDEKDDIHLTKKSTMARLKFASNHSKKETKPNSLNYVNSKSHKSWNILNSDSDSDSDITHKITSRTKLGNRNYSESLRDTKVAPTTELKHTEVTGDRRTLLSVDFDSKLDIISVKDTRQDEGANSSSDSDTYEDMMAKRRSQKKELKSSSSHALRLGKSLPRSWSRRHEGPRDKQQTCNSSDRMASSVELLDSKARKHDNWDISIRDTEPNSVDDTKFENVNFSKDRLKSKVKGDKHGKTIKKTKTTTTTTTTITTIKRLKEDDDSFIAEDSILTENSDHHHS